MLNNITELLGKFDKIGFDTYKSKEFKKADWTLRYRPILCELNGAQILFNLYYREKCVQTWGCVDDDNKTAAMWIKNKQREIQYNYFKQEYDAENIGKELFKTL